jgi:heterodisulfide reductase subunit A-like polyferredoxin
MSLKRSMSIEEELPLLKARARAIGARLDLLRRRINSIQHESKTARHIAVIDSEKCLGCGICEAICQVGAISIKNIALVDAFRCTGCGRCADECPQEAIVLRPYQTAGTLVWD